MAPVQQALPWMTDDVPDGPSFPGLILSRELQRGAFGTVYRAHDTAGVGGGEAHLEGGCARRADAAAAAQARPPRIVRHHRAIELEGTRAVVMQLATIDVFDHTEHRPSHGRALEIVRDLRSGLAYLHANSIVHLDVKRRICC